MLRLYMCNARLFAAHRKNRHAAYGLTRPLRIEVEAADRRDLVAPPLDARRRRHTEPIDVENAATDTVLRDFGHCRHALVTHCIETLCRIAQAPFLFMTSITSRACSSAAGTAVSSALARAV